MDDQVKYGHHKYLSQIAEADVAYVLKKDVSYGASWRWSGGANAWAMVRRKIDRLMEMLRPLSASDKQNILDFAQECEKAGPGLEGYHTTRYYTSPENMAELLRRSVQAEDVFITLRTNPSGEDGTVLAEIRDLRRYLLLLEAGMMDDLHMMVEPPPVPHGTITARELRCAFCGELHAPEFICVAKIPRNIEDSNRHALQEEEMPL